MSTHNICFHGEIIKLSILLDWKKHLIKSYVYVFFVSNGNPCWFYMVSDAADVHF